MTITKCILCGKEIQSPQYICEDCKNKDNKEEYAKSVKVKKCPHCGSIFLGKWINGAHESDEIVRLAISSINKFKKLDYEVTGDESNMRVRFTGVEPSRNLETEGDFFIRLSFSSCPVCTKKLGNYYEGILQIRGGTKSSRETAMDESSEAFERDSSAEVFLTKVNENREGYDLFISSKQYTRTLGKELLDSFGGSIKETSHLMGRKKGKDLYRITISVRIPDFEKGDIIKMEGKYHLVEGIRRNRASIIDLKSGKKQTCKISEMERYSVFKKEDSIREVDVLYREGHTAYILDPFDFIERAVSDSQNKDRITVAKLDDEIYVIPIT